MEETPAAKRAGKTERRGPAETSGRRREEETRRGNQKNQRPFQSGRAVQSIHEIGWWEEKIKK